MAIKEQDLVMILDRLDFKIRKHIKETSLNEREDLSQEIKIKIIEKIDFFLNEEVPGFFEFTQTID